MNVLLIPSAILIPREMRKNLGDIPTCLFPLGDKAMLEKIYEHYKDKVDLFYLVVGKEQQQVYDYLNAKTLPIKVVSIDCVKDLGYTIYSGLRQILIDCPSIGKICINFADTILSNQVEFDSKDVIFYSKEQIEPQWTFFTSNKGKICSIVDKPTQIHVDNTLENVFVGVFYISDLPSFLEKLKNAVLFTHNNIDTFYLALLEYTKEHSCEFLLCGKWFDVGHSEKYIQAKTKVPTRAFNTIEIDESRGILKKTSDNTKKFIDEIEWYLKMPKNLKYLIPHIYDYSLAFQSPYIIMEYYGYRTLHEVLIFGNVSIAQWQRYFLKLRFILDDMASYSYHENNTTIKNALAEMYISKTIDRLNDLKNDSRFSAFFNENIKVNKKTMPSLSECIEKFPYLLKKRLLNKESYDFCIIHGDLCFSNILIESEMGFLRIIDPRGRFGSLDIYGDRRYELAKLMHSLDGQYDYIIEDLFTVQVDGTTIELELKNKTKEIYDSFRAVFADTLVNYLDLKLIESLLFFSMIPLHNDALNRQYAMLATGLRLLDEATEGKWFEH